MAKKQRTKRKQLKKKLLHKYRLVVLNEDTFEEKISFKLNRLNVFVTGTLFAIVLIAGTTFLIAFTPLKEYIPGYASTKLRQEATDLTFEVDSLQNKMSANEIYFNSIQKVLKGEIAPQKINKDSLLESFKTDTALANVEPSKQDSLLRKEVALEDKYNLFETATTKGDYVFFPPLKGAISNDFNTKEKHFGIDITAPEGTPVKAVADGTVIFSEWTAETGYVCVIDHGSNLISVYKHNSALTISQGDFS